MIGLGIFLEIQVEAINHRQDVAVAQPDDNPRFKGGVQFVPAFLQGGTFAPDAPALRNRAVKKRPFSMTS